MSPKVIYAFPIVFLFVSRILLDNQLAMSVSLIVKTQSQVH